MLASLVVVLVVVVGSVVVVRLVVVVLVVVSKPDRPNKLKSRASELLSSNSSLS